MKVLFRLGTNYSPGMSLKRWEVSAEGDGAQPLSPVAGKLWRPQAVSSIFSSENARDTNRQCKNNDDSDDYEKKEEKK